MTRFEDVNNWYAYYGVANAPSQPRVNPIKTRAASPGVLPPARNSEYLDVTVDRATTLPSVYASIRIISTSVAQLRLRAMRAGEEVFPAIIKNPDVNETLPQWLKRTSISLSVDGNAYWKITRDSKGAVSNLEVLNPLAMNPRVIDGRKVYDYAGDEYRASQTFSSTSIKHLRLGEYPGSIKGRGPIQACRATINSGLALDRFGKNWFQEAGVPTGLLTSDQALFEGEAEEFRDRWHEIHSEQGVAVLGKGFKYEPITIKPADALWIDAQRFSVQDISRIFGVPVHLLAVGVDGTSMSYSNVQDSDLAFVKYGLMPYLSEIEGALSSLLPRGTEVEFKIDGFLRPTPKARAEVQKLYFDMGVLTVNEIRAQEGLPPLPEPAPKPTDEVTP